jgi:hypothetical protein
VSDVVLDASALLAVLPAVPGAERVEPRLVKRKLALLAGTKPAGTRGRVPAQLPASLFEPGETKAR